MPDKGIKSNCLHCSMALYSNLPRPSETNTKNMAMIAARTVVARVVSIPCNPILPKIATSAANTAPNNAKNIQVMFLL